MGLGFIAKMSGFFGIFLTGAGGEFLGEVGVWVN
jgi:hypothetical protein